MASVQTARLLLIFHEKDLEQTAWGEIKRNYETRGNQRGRSAMAASRDRGGGVDGGRVDSWKGGGAYIEGERLGFR
jgi:hypothetical protein